MAAAARELTKLHEEIIRGSLEELVNHFKDKDPRGEFTLIVDGAGAENMVKN
jgi:16S rRNA (cytidine1402-2'-O)-methyltransferase